MGNKQCCGANSNNMEEKRNYKKKGGTPQMRRRKQKEGKSRNQSMNEDGQMLTMVSTASAADTYNQSLSVPTSPF